MAGQYVRDLAYLDMITVIIAAYNAERTIERAIRSALAEPEATEVVVVDDASVDRTVPLSHACDDGTGRLKILTQKENNGPAAARNYALRESTKPWVTVLDSDDFFISGRLKGLLSQAQGFDLVADDMFQMLENSVDGKCKKLLGEAINLPREVSFEDFVLSNVSCKKRERAEMGFIKPLIRRAFLAQHQLCYAENMRLGEDYELYARALGCGAKMILLPAQGYVSVVRSNSLSGNHSIQDLVQLYECDRVLMRDINLTPVEKNALRIHSISIDKRLQWRKLIDAIKNKKLLSALGTFTHHHQVTLFLLSNLLMEMYSRTLKCLKLY